MSGPSFDHEAFLATVAAYVQKNPEVAPRVSDAAQAGLTRALSESRQYAADMETVAGVLASRRYKGSDELVKSKLRKHQGRTYMNWDWLLGQAESQP